jgi:hypothetical protein
MKYIGGVVEVSLRVYPTHPATRAYGPPTPTATMTNLHLVVISFLSIHIIAMSHPKLAIATRLHLGHASHPPPTQQLTETLSNFAKLALDTGANIAVVAVDAEDKLEGYSLISEVEVICRRLNLVQEQNKCMIDILPVQPWGKFIPALNAIIS